MYAAPEYQTLAADMCALIDMLAAGAGEAERGRMLEHFITSSRYEYAFWQMAWTQEQWPV